MTPRSDNSRHPGILKYTQQQRNGIQSQQITRHGIGYVVRGKKFLYYGDVCHVINAGDLFYLNTGIHYMEDVPEEGKPFEQIVFYYSPENLGDILSSLSLNYNMQDIDTHSCDNCDGKHYVAYPAWSAIKSFFTSTAQYLKENIFTGEGTAEQLKATELIYLIMSHPECCIKSCILANADSIGDNFERTIQQHIFSDISIEELAKICNKSLTSFKKEFKEHFHEPPHRWMIRQRLMHSRLLLISTSKSVSEIGNECNFPNTSHYIKLFKKEYGLTPAAYRTKSKRAAVEMA